MEIDGSNIAGACVTLVAIVVTFLGYRYREGRGETLAEQIARERQYKNDA